MRENGIRAGVDFHFIGISIFVKLEKDHFSATNVACISEFGKFFSDIAELHWLWRNHAGHPGTLVVSRQLPANSIPHYSFHTRLAHRLGAAKRPFILQSTIDLPITDNEASSLPSTLDSMN